MQFEIEHNSHVFCFVLSNFKSNNFGRDKKMLFVALVISELKYFHKEMCQKKQHKFDRYMKNVLKLDGVAPLIADPPPLKVHQKARSTPSVKWP